jgi:bifunctional DNase/RNase
LVKAEIWTVARTEQGNAVLVRPIGADVAVPIFIGQLETQSILIGFGGVPMPRPLTHDLMLSLIKTFGADLLRIEIHDLREGTFYARLILDVDGEERTVDSRPSDAIALAVRKKCPVYIAESVVDAAGIAIELIIDTETPVIGEAGAPAAKVAGDERATLQAELDKAVASEEYEHAAAIRNMLKALEKRKNEGQNSR